MKAIRKTSVLALFIAIITATVFTSCPGTIGGVFGNAVFTLFVDKTELIADTPFDFGDVLLGESSAEIVFTVKNAGVADLELPTGVTIIGAGAELFGVSKDPVGVVTPGNETTFSIIFTPAGGVGEKVASVRIEHRGGEVDTTFTFNIVGTATEDAGSIAPTVSLTSTAPDPTGDSPIPVTITFSEVVTGLELSEISVTNGSASDLATTNAVVFTVGIIPSGSLTELSVFIDANAAQNGTAVGNTASNLLTLSYDGSIGTPIDVSALLAQAADGQVILNWTNPTAQSFSGVAIRRNTGSHPSSIVEGIEIYTGSADAITDSGLSNGTTYYYTAFTYNSVPVYSAGVQTQATPDAAPAPAEVSGFSAAADDEQVSLSWTNPTDPSFAGVRIQRSDVGDPSGPSEGSTVYEGTGTSFDDTGLTNGTTYYYRAFTYNAAPTYSTGVSDTATPLDTTAPAAVSSLTATPADGEISLTWVNPGDTDLDGVMIRRSDTAFPTDETQGVQAYSGTGESFTDTGLTNGTTYYYTAFAYDEVPNYSSGETQSEIPIGTPATPDPADGSASYDATPLLDWVDASGAASYEIRYSTDSGTLSTQTPVSISPSEYQIPAPFSTGETVYWQVRSVNTNSSYGTWSGIWSYTVSMLLTEVLVEGGTFQMGSASGESDEQPVHTVTLTRNFFMSAYEITQSQWFEIMGTNPSLFTGADLPVEQVTWYDAVDFCNALSDLVGLDRAYSGSGDSTVLDLDANGYRLPTEAEWEYAAKGGNLSMGYAYSGSDTIDDVAWYIDNSDSTSHNVGTKVPNEIGIYDMTGNVWEWCWDWYDSGYYSVSPSNDPTGPASGTTRPWRGGGWGNAVGYLPVYWRNGYSPATTSESLGFRPVRSVPSPAQLVNPDFSNGLTGWTFFDESTGGGSVGASEVSGRLRIDAHLAGGYGGVSQDFSLRTPTLIEFDFELDSSGCSGGRAYLVRKSMTEDYLLSFHTNHAPPSSGDIYTFVNFNETIYFISGPGAYIDSGTAKLIFDTVSDEIEVYINDVFQLAIPVPGGFNLQIDRIELRGNNGCSDGRNDTYMFYDNVILQ